MSASMFTNTHEGNAKNSNKERARYLRIALGSTFECAAILDVLVARGSGSRDEVEEGKQTLERISKMLVALLRSLGSTLPS
jgi:four helix bundle protein